MELITRKEAKAQGLKTYCTGKSCKRGHTAGRYVTSAACVECRKALNADWVSRNPGRMSDLRKRWDSENREHRRRYAVDRHNKNPSLYLWNTARTRARRLGVPFSIAVEDIVVPHSCPVFGCALEFGGDSDTSPSLDRLIPSLGYVPGNVIVVSNRANRIKNDATISELQKITAFYSGIIQQPQAEI
jgi:hypothetical protein